jgi:hypothetical protein
MMELGVYTNFKTVYVQNSTIVGEIVVELYDDKNNKLVLFLDRNIISSMIELLKQAKEEL